MTSSELMIGQSGAEKHSGALDPIEMVKLPSGDIVPVHEIVMGGVDDVLRGYIVTAQSLGGEMAAHLYKRANPQSELDGSWFEHNKFRTEQSL